MISSLTFCSPVHLKEQTPALVHLQGRCPSWEPAFNPSFTDPLEILAGGVSEPEPLAIHGHLQSSRASLICVFQHPYSDRRAGFDLYLSSFSFPAGSWALPWGWWVHLAKQHMQNTIFRAVEVRLLTLLLNPFWTSPPLCKANFLCIFFSLWPLHCLNGFLLFRYVQRLTSASSPTAFHGDCRGSNVN